MNTIEKLSKFVNQKPGLEFANYGDVTCYRSEMREITADRNDFFELLSIAASRYDNELNEVLTKELKSSSGRLTLNEKDQLEYTTGQYFCTEYRPAACSVLSRLIFRSYANEKRTDGTEVYKDGNEIRKALKLRGVSRRLMKNYFN